MDPREEINAFCNWVVMYEVVHGGTCKTHPNVGLALAHEGTELIACTAD